MLSKIKTTQTTKMQIDLAWVVATTTQILPTKSKECNNRTHLCRLPHGAHIRTVNVDSFPQTATSRAFRTKWGKLERGNGKWERGHKLRHSLPRVRVRYEYELLLTLAAG